jgi:hypothetical protein
MDQMDHEAGRISDQGSDEKYPKDDVMATRVLGLEASVNQLMEDTGSSLPNTSTIGEQIEDLTKRVEKTEARGLDGVFEMDQFIYVDHIRILLKWFWMTRCSRRECFGIFSVY